MIEKRWRRLEPKDKKPKGCKRTHFLYQQFHLLPILPLAQQPVTFLFPLSFFFLETRVTFQIHIFPFGPHYSHVAMATLCRPCHVDPVIQHFGPPHIHSNFPPYVPFIYIHTQSIISCPFLCGSTPIKPKASPS